MRDHPDPIRLDRRDWRILLPGTALLLGLTLCLGRCSGGGGGSGGGFLDVVSFSATLQSPRVYLNDSIEIVFNQPVDARTVFSGVYIYPSVSAGSKRARGEYRPCPPIRTSRTAGSFRTRSTRSVFPFPERRARCTSRTARASSRPRAGE